VALSQRGCGRRGHTSPRMRSVRLNGGQPVFEHGKRRIGFG
jgi:hypothetical protein